MNRIDQTFQRLRAEGKTALIPFLTIGDPDIDTSIAIVKELEAAGADIVELGVPYSDPLADGPVIQRASERALKHGITIYDCIRMAKRAREEGVSLPFILFTYYNPVLQMGLEKFFALLKDNDISGMIIPDLPIEEDEAVRSLAEKNGIHLVPLVAPTSNARIERIASRAQGFVYCVSSLGVTGVRSEFHSGIEDFLTAVKRASNLPIAVGFGISNNEHVRYFSEYCDGVVVGSAIVRKIEEVLPQLADQQSPQAGLGSIRDFVRQLKGNS
jgi:tryptophan synthase alpha chain